MRHTVFVFFFIFLSMYASAEESPWNVNGFATLGLVYNPSPDFDFVREISQTKGAGRSGKFDLGVDSLLGLQVNYRPEGSFDAMAQAIVERRLDSSYSPEISWAFVRYSFSEQKQLRIGRLGVDFYHLADSRSIAYSYLWVRLPVDFFGDLFIRHIDGFDWLVSWPGSTGTWKSKLYAGRLHGKGSSRNNVIDLDNNPAAGFYLEFQDADWLMRAGYARMRAYEESPLVASLVVALQTPLVNLLAPGANTFAQQVSHKDKNVDYLSLGIAYDHEPWLAQFMLGQVKNDSVFVARHTAYFATLAYHTGRYTPYLGYSKLNIQNQDTTFQIRTGLSPALDALAHNVATLSGNRLTQSTYTLGLRIDLQPKLSLKLQVDRLHTPFTVQQIQTNLSGSYPIYSLALDYVF